MIKRLFKQTDLRGSTQDCFPRILWQGLYDFYAARGGDLTNLDNLLIDYENCKKLFDGVLSNKFLFGVMGFSTTWMDSKDFYGNLKMMCDIRGFDSYLLVEVDEDIITYGILQ